MDVNDISNCLTLIEDALSSNIFKYDNTNIHTERLVKTLKMKQKKIKKEQTEKSTCESTNYSGDISSEIKQSSTCSKSDQYEKLYKKNDLSETSTINSDSENSIATNLSGNYSNIQPLTIGSELFKISDSEFVDSNSCYNLAFLYNNDDNTEVDAKIITYRK